MFAARGVSQGWLTVLVGFVGMMVGPSALLTTSFSVLAAGLENSTRWPHSTVAYGSALISLVVLVTSPLQGYLTDRIGGRRLILLSMPLFGFTLIGFQLATASVASFYVICMLAALAGLGVWPAPFMKVASGWFDRRLGLAFGVITTGMAASTAVLPILFGWSFRRIGWSATYTMIGLVIIVIIYPATAVLLRDAEKPITAKRDLADTSRVSLFAAVRARSFWIALALFFALGAVSAAILIHGVAILRSDGLSLRAALRTQAIVGLGAVVGRLGTGWFLDRASVRVVGAIMFTVAAAYFLILDGPFAAALSPVAAGCGGLVVGAELNVLGVLIRRHLSVAVFGRVYGLAFSGFHLGGAVGASGLAILLARTGSFNSGLVMLLITSLGCTLLLVALGRDPVSLDGDLS